MTISSGRIAPFAEIVGRRCSHVDRRPTLARHDEPRSMEQHRPAWDTVDAVANDSAAERLAGVRADLVRASRDGTKFDQSGAMRRNPPPARYCRSPMFVRNHPPTGFRARVLRERNIDHAFFLANLSGNDGEIIFLDLPRFERALEFDAGF